MEKHPIDDLFARRLHDHEQTPSARTWDTLESRMGRNKPVRRAAWYWAAASVVLVAGGLAAWRHQAAPEPVAAVRKAVPPSPPANRLPTAEPAAAAKLPASEPVLAGRTAPQGPDAPTARPAKNRPGHIHTKPILAETGLVAQQPAPAPHETLATVPTPPEPVADLAAPDVTVVVVQLSETGLATTGDTPETPERPRNKAGKLWQTIKKAKQSELNLDKDALFAWAKDKSSRNEPR